MKLLVLRCVAVVCAAFALQLLAADNPRVVLKGYDPVAYFTDGKPVRGNAGIAHDWDGGRYHFVSDAHRQMFAADPERYAPQFAGFCTGSMSRGKKNEGHPEAWVVVDGKLFVFGAKDSEAALKMKRNAEKDLDAFRAKAGNASGHWHTLRTSQ